MDRADAPDPSGTTDDPTATSGLLWAGVSEGVVLVNGSGRVVEVSPNLCELYDVDRPSLVGRPVIGMVHAEDRVTLEAYLERPLLVDPTSALRLRVAQGEAWSPSDVRVALVDGPQGVALRLVLRPASDEPVPDVTNVLDTLDLVDEMKHRLLESVSHEMRTPLTVLLGLARTLQRPGLELPPETMQQLGASAERQAERLERIVIELSELDQASRGALLVEAHEVDLAAVVLGVLENVSLGGRTLHTEVHPVLVEIDRRRIERLLENVLANTRRHTLPDTNVWVRVEAHPAGALLEVIDDGPGIPDHLRDDVFSPFVQGPSRDPASPGLGLGLSLVRRFAEMHGGRCWISTPEGGGTAVHVLLPRRRRAPTDPEVLASVLRDAAAYERAARDPGDGQPRIRPDALGLISPILRSVCQELDMQVAYLSAFTPSEQVVLAVEGDGEHVGITAGARYDLEDTYCVRMVRGDVGRVVADTTAEPALADLPPTRDGIGAYVGVPVRLPDGHVFGTLCCATDQTRPELSARHAAVLEAVARVIGNQLGQGNVVAGDDGEATRRIERLLSWPDSLRAVDQPIVDLATGEVVGAEALSRFPDSDVRPPETWFADAARVGLDHELDQVALLRAVGGLDALDGLYLSVNVTPAAVLRGGLRPLLGRLPMDRLVLEITEHAAVTDYTHLGSALRPFRAAGARLAIDDVGSGFANLRHVMRTRPDIIKIDRSLVGDLTADPVQEAIVGALTHVALQIGASIVAEGIEDADTLRGLRALGVTHGQGYLFDRPGPLPLRTRRYPVT